MSNGPEKLGNGPLLKMDLAHKKPLNHAGFRHFGPFAHFFSLINMKKNIFYIII